MDIISVFNNMCETIIVTDKLFETMTQVTKNLNDNKDKIVNDICKTYVANLKSKYHESTTKYNSDKFIEEYNKIKLDDRMPFIFIKTLLYICLFGFVHIYKFKTISGEQKVINKVLLDEPIFIVNFYNLVWSMWKLVALTFNDLDNLNQIFITNVNAITRSNYIVLNCNPEIHIIDIVLKHQTYTCGRGLLPIVESGKNTRLILLNTISSDDDTIDEEYYVSDKGASSLTGGNYYNKYMKYQKKILNL
jgi:hypothetical protein